MEKLEKAGSAIWWSVIAVPVKWVAPWEHRSLPDVAQLSSRLYSLTSTEIKVADLVKLGKTTKEIAAP